MRIEHHAPTTTLGNPDDWEKAPFRLAGIEIPTDLGDVQAANLTRLVEATYKLYSDPWLAVVREYTCNGKDIHRRIKSRSALDVFFPTRLRQEFVVRDYGTGLDDEGMHMRFGSYGSSDKNDTDDENGAFGIGCKAAFGVTPNFTVASFQPNEHGVMTKTVWHVTRDEGIGALYKLKQTFEVPNEKAGLEVSIPCNSDEWGDLQSRLEDFLVYFDHPVTVHNQPEDWNVRVPKHSVKGSEFKLGKYNVSWKLRQTEGYKPVEHVNPNRRPNRRSNVINGGVCYEINAYSLLNLPEPEDDMEREAWRTSQNMLDNLNDLSLDIWISVGGVDLARTREQLDYNRRLTGVLAEVMKVVAAESQERYNELSTKEIEGDGIDLRNYIREFRSSHKGFAKLLGKDKLPYVKMRSTEGAVAQSSTLDLKEFNAVESAAAEARRCKAFTLWAPRYRPLLVRGASFGLAHHNIEWVDGNKRNKWVGKAKLKREHIDNKAHRITGDEVFFFDDTDLEKINPLVWGAVKDGVEQIKIAEDGEITLVQIIGNKSDLPKLLDYYKIRPDRIVFLSEVEKYNPYPRARKTVTKADGTTEPRPLPRYYSLRSDNLPRDRYNNLRGCSFIPKEDMWKRIAESVSELDISEDRERIAVKVGIRRGQWDDSFGTFAKDDERGCSNYDLRNLVASLAKLSDKPIDVYAFNPRDYDKVEMTSLCELIRELVPKAIAKFAGYHQILMRHRASQEINPSHNPALANDVANVVLGDEFERVDKWYNPTLNRSYIDTSKAVAKLTSAVGEHASIEGDLGWRLGEESERKADTVCAGWERRMKKLLARKPLLRYVNGAPKELIRQHMEEVSN